MSSIQSYTSLPTVLLRFIRWGVGFMCAASLVVSPFMSHRAYAATVPATATPLAPATVPLGQSFNFDISFDNTGGVTGFGPYINLFMPTAGSDGNDGIDLTTATYLGSPLTTFKLDCPSSTTVVSPLTGLPVVCPTSPSGTNTLYVLQLPFGSFTPAQAPAIINVTAKMSNLADEDKLLPITTQAGFIYGDSPVRFEPSQGITNTASVDPTLFTLNKTSDEPESETATGPNYVRQYFLTPSMPTGLTASNVVITDELPNDMVILGVTGATVLSAPAIPGGPYAPPNNRVVMNYGNLTGTGAPIAIRYYITRTDALNAAILSPTAGGTRTRVNNTSARGNWLPTDPRDGAVTITGTAALTNTDKTIAIQKSVLASDNPVRPGTLLTYTLSFQVSDFFSLGNLIVTDTLSDGLGFTTGTPKLVVSDRNGSVSGAIPLTTTTVTNLGAGGTRVRLDLSAAMRALGAADGILQGGRAIAPNAGAAVGTITYQAKVNDVYAANTGLQPADTLPNNALMGGDVLPNNNIAAAPTGRTSDDTSASVALGTPPLSKNFFAINNSQTLPSPLKLSPGDLVTYRLKYDLVTADYINMRLTDYLPLPVFDALTVSNFVSTTAGIPPLGQAQWGPSMATGGHLSRMGVPTMTTDATENSIVFNFGTRDDASNSPTTVEILFTVKVLERPMLDSLFLTNQVNSRQDNTAGTPIINNAIQAFNTAAPKMLLRKGIVGSNNPKSVLTSTAGLVNFAPVGNNACPARFSGTVNSVDVVTNPIDANIQQVDAGDTVRMALVVENLGGARLGAYDMAVNDVLPPNMTYVPNTLCVQNGAGTLLPTITPSTTLFSTGLTLTVPLSQGINYADVVTTSGRNIAVISFDVLIGTAISPTRDYTNTATVQSFASQPAGPNFVPVQLPSTRISDTARVSTAAFQLGKSLVGTELNNATNSPSQATIGEYITYTVVLSVPEGTAQNARITDTLPTGLGFVACDALALSAGLATSISPFNAATLCSASGNVLSFNLGNLTNSNTNNAITETIAITYRAIVLNVGGNVTGTTRLNNASFNWQGNTPLSAASSDVTVIEPRLQTSKSSNVSFGDAFDRITYTIFITNPSTNSSTAYDVVLTDTIPTGMTFVGGSLATQSGPAAAFNISAPTFTATWASLLPGQTAVITFQASINGNVGPSERITNTGILNFNTLPGSVGTRTADANSTERGYTGINAASVLIVSPPQINKVLVGTEYVNANNSNAQAVIGELITYTLVVTVPEGLTVNARIVDTLDSGLALVSFNAVTASAALQFDQALATYLTPTIAAVSGEGGRRATWSFGTITNTDNNNAISETLQLTYTVMVLNTNSNVSGQSRRNSAVFTWFGGSLPAARAANVSLIEPSMGISKTVLPNTGDSGDVITYTLVLTGPSGTDAYDVTLTDRLPFTTSGTLLLNPGIASVTTNATPALTPANFNLSGSNSTGYTLTTPAPIDFALNATRRITLVITGTLPTYVVPSQLFTNTVVANWSSLDEFSAITRSVYNPNSIERTYTSTADIPFRVIPLIATKEFVTTSEGFTANTAANPRVAIGEVVQYRLWIQMAEALAPNLAIDFLDILPTGLQFINDTTRIAFVSNGNTGGIQSSALTNTLPNCGGLAVAGNTVSGTLPTQVTCPLPSNLVTLDGQGRPKFSFGTVNNYDTDTDGEYIIVQFNAVVLNVAGNQSGTPLANLYDVLVNGVKADSSEPVTMTVAEPDVRSAKSVSVLTPVDAGDLVTYTLVMSNVPAANTSTAFDVVLTDVLDSNLELLNASFVADVPVTNYTSASNSLITTTNAITLNIAQLNAGGGVTVTLIARVRDLAVNGLRWNNVARLGYTSLPTTTGTLSNTTQTNTPGASGTVTGERTFTGGVNDLVNTSNLITNSLNTPTLAKLAPTPAQYTLGDLITYTLQITTPEGVAQELSVLDDLPTGLIFVSSQVFTSGAPLAADYTGTLPTPAVTNPNNDVLFAFGNITTTADNAANNNSFLIQVVVRVANVPANQNGSTLLNSAALTYTHPISGITGVNGGSQTISIIEPRLTTSKSVATPRTPVGAGDVVTYTIRITNTGTAPAFDVNMTDTLPTGVTFLATQSLSVGNTATTTDTNVVGSTNQTWQVSQLSPGNSAVVIFTALVNANIGANQTLINQTASSYSSLPGSPPQERPYTTTVATAQMGTSTSNVGVIKTASASASAGELFTYTLIARNTGVVAATNVVVTDRVPLSTTFVSYEPLATGVQQNGLVTWSIASIAANSDAVFTLTVRINEPLVNGTRLVNTAFINNGNGSVITPTSTVTTLIASAHTLGLSKSVNPSTAQPKDLVTYTLAYTISGNEPAFNVVLTDALPASLSFVSSAPPPTNQSGQTQSWSLGAFSPTQQTPISGVITLSARLANVPVLSGTQYLNNARVADSTALSATSNATVTVGSAHALSVTKSASPSPVTAGTRLTYTLAYTVSGNEPAQNVLLQDVLPSGVTYVSSSPSATTTSGNVVSWVLGNITPTTSNQLQLVVNVLPSVANGGVLTNTVSISDTNNGVTGTHTIATPVLRSADIGIDKTDSPDPVAVQGTLTYTLNYTNTGPSEADNVIVTDTLPDSVVFVSAVPAPSTQTGNVLAWNLGTLAQGSTGSIVLSVTVPAGAPEQLSNSVVITSPTPDPNLINNTDTEPTRVLYADVYASKDVRPRGVVIPGQLMTFTIVFGNRGNLTATNVTITDAIPNGIVFGGIVSQSPLLNLVVGTPPTLTWGAASLPPNASGNIVFTATSVVQTSLDNVVQNVVAIRSSTPQTNTTNDTGSTQTPRIDLTASKVASRSPVIVGEQVSFTIVLTNSGGFTLTTIPLTDTYDANVLQLNDVSRTPDVSTTGELRWTNLGPLAPDQEITIVLTYTALVKTNGAFTYNVITTTGEFSGVVLPPRISTAPVQVTLPSLSVRKLSESDNGLPVRPGETLSYTVVISNAGDADATGVNVRDPLPTNTRFVVGSGRIAPNADALPFGTPPLLVDGLRVGANSSVTLTYAVLVNTPLPNGTLIINTANLSSTNGGVITPTATVTDVIQSSHALALQKSVVPSTAAPGDLVTYTLAYTVSGDEPAVNVVITDTLPNEITFVSAVPAPTTQTGNVTVWELGTVNTPVSGSIVFTARVTNTATPNGTTYPNNANIADSATLSATSNATVTVASGHALSITKRAEPSIVVAGTPITFTIEYTVTGNETAQNVFVRDGLPAGVTYVSSVPTATNIAGNIIAWELGNLTPVTNGVFTVYALVDANVLSGTTLLNQVTISDTNNGITATGISRTPAVALADPRVSKFDNGDPVVAGETLTYTVVFTNIGPSDDQNVVMIDTLPTGIAYGGVVSAVPNIAPVVNGQTLTWNLGTLAQGASGRFVFTTTATVGAAEAITNTVTITSSTPDADPSNNTAAEPAQVTYADVFVRKDVTPTVPVVPGETLTWTIAFGNAGTAVAQNVRITDVLPSGAQTANPFTFTATCTCIVIETGVGAWTVSDLAPNQNGQIVFTMTSNLRTGPDVVLANTVFISTTTPQTTTTNDTATTTNPKLDVGVQKTVSRSPVVVGEQVSYTLRVFNLGAVELVTVPLTDTFDATKLAFVSASLPASTSTTGQLVWDSIGSIAPQQNASVVVTFTALASTQGLSSTNVITAVGLYPGSQPVPVGAVANVRITQPALSVNKTSSGNARPNMPLTYTVVVRNDGDADATGVSVHDALPTNTQFIVGSEVIVPNDNGAVFAAPPVSVDGILVRANASVTLTYAVRVAAPLPNGTLLVNGVSISNTHGGVLTPTARVTDSVTSSHTLLITKTGDAQAIAGQTVNYRIEYSVSGDEPAQDVTVVDVLPAPLIYLASEPAATSVVSNVVSWSLGNINPPATGVITLSARVPASVTNGTTLLNVATLSDTKAISQTSSVQTNVQMGADLSIRKSVQPSVVYNGGLVTYTLVAYNSGPSDVGNDLINKIVMPGNGTTTIGAAAPYPSEIKVNTGGTLQDITVTLHSLTHSYVGDLDVVLVAPNGQKVLLMSDAGGEQGVSDVTLQFHDGAPRMPDFETMVSGTYRPTDFVGNDGIDNLPNLPRPYGNALAAFVGAPADGNWKLYVFDDQDNDAGVAIRGWTLTLRTSNGAHSVSSSSGMQVLDVLPAGVSIVSATAGYAGPNPITWIDALKAGETQTYTVVARVTKAGADEVTNTAFITSSLPETTLINNTSTATVTILSVNLGVTNTGVPTNTPPGGSVVISVPIQNNGNVTATNVVVTITLPAGVVITQTPPGWVQVSPGVYVVVIPEIPPGGSVVVVIPVTVSEILPNTTGGSIVIVVGDDGTHGTDPNPNDNTIIVPVPFDITPKFAFTKSAEPGAGASVRVGDRITYTLTLTNTGGVTMTAVILNDSVPMNTVYVPNSAVPALASGPSPQLMWNMGALPPKSSVSVRFAVTVTAISTTTLPIQNTAWVQGQNVSVTLSNELIHVFQPSQITLVRFDATRTEQGVRVNWVTGVEINTFGFALYRSVDGDRANAILVTPELIFGRSPSGASYEFTDTASDANTAYVYWLQEIETTGTVNEYGPIATKLTQQSEQRHQFFLPVVNR